MKCAVFAVLLAIPVVVAAQPEASLPAPGPWFIKGAKLWTFGPLAEHEEFTIPANDPFGRVYVYTGALAGGLSPHLEYFTQGDWRNILTLNSGAQLLGNPRPGIVLQPGQYKLTGIPPQGPGFVFGYLAPPTSRPTYSGMDEYPPQDKIWSVHRWFNGMLFTVPEGRVFVLTFAVGGIDRYHQGTFQWVRWLDSYPPAKPLALPGLRLPPGEYRLSSDALYCGGFITTEN